jgi:hypothetical protein
LDDLLESAWFRFAWAVVNGERLKEDINAFALDANAQTQLRLDQHYDAKRHCIVLTIAEFLRPFPKKWGLLLGDTVHNYRSALDHLAWALVQRGTKPVLSNSQASGVYFPIADTRHEFNASLVGKRPKLPGVRRADIAIVRRYQPYIHGQRNVPNHVFFVLDQLSRHDKHRTIQPIVGTPEAAYFKAVAQHDCLVRRVRRRALRRALKVGTEVGWIFVKRTGPNPQIEMEGEIPVYPAINERLRLEKWLEVTMGITFKLLREFGEPFEGAMALIDAHAPPPPSPSKG